MGLFGAACGVRCGCGTNGCVFSLGATSSEVLVQKIRRSPARCGAGRRRRSASVGPGRVDFFGVAVFSCQSKKVKKVVKIPRQRLFFSIQQG